MNKRSKTSSGNGHAVEVLPQPKSSKKKIKVAPINLDEHHQQLAGVLDNRELLRVLSEVRNGNFTARMPFDQIGLSGKICDTLNDIISLNEKMVQEFMRAGNTFGKQ